MDVCARHGRTIFSWSGISGRRPLGANGLLLVPYKEKPGIREQGTSCGAFERVKHALAIFVPPG